MLVWIIPRKSKRWAISENRQKKLQTTKWIVVNLLLLRKWLYSFQSSLDNESLSIWEFDARAERDLGRGYSFLSNFAMNMKKLLCKSNFSCKSKFPLAFSKSMCYDAHTRLYYVRGQRQIFYHEYSIKPWRRDSLRFLFLQKGVEKPWKNELLRR